MKVEATYDMVKAISLLVHDLQPTSQDLVDRDPFIILIVATVTHEFINLS